MPQIAEIHGDEDDFHVTSNGTYVNFLHVIFRYGTFFDAAKVRDHSHIDQKLWEDEPPVKGYIKTHCKACKAWIGTRPAVPGKRTRTANQFDEAEQEPSE